MDGSGLGAWWQPLAPVVVSVLGASILLTRDQEAASGDASAGAPWRSREMEAGGGCAPAPREAARQSNTPVDLCVLSSDGSLVRWEGIEIGYSGPVPGVGVAALMCWVPREDPAGACSQEDQGRSHGRMTRHDGLLSCESRLAPSHPPAPPHLPRGCFPCSARVREPRSKARRHGNGTVCVGGVSCSVPRHAGMPSLCLVALYEWRVSSGC